MCSIVCYFLLLSIIVIQTVCKECPPLTSEDVKKVCTHTHGGIVSCEYPIRPGTKANITCKPYFEYSAATPYTSRRETTCLENGTWDLSYIDIVPECGSTTLFGNNQIVNGSTTELGIFPWHVGVYYVNWISGVLDHVCGGSLISTELVVSAAHCFYDETERRLQDARNYAVATGKLFRSYYQTEEYQQTSQIQSIYVPHGYRGTRNKQRKDVAILRLYKRFDITNFVRPVCVDFNDAYTEEQLRSQQIGKVMGWGDNGTGYAHEELQQINLPYIDHNSCQENAPNNFSSLVTSDKICAGYLNGSSTCYGDSGGGLCFRSESNKRWYLRGIVSVGDFIKKGDEVRCNSFYYTAFTNVANYTHWIESVMTDAGIPLDRKSGRVDNAQPCILPEPPKHGNFEHELCKGSCNYVPGFPFPIGSVLDYNCEKGYSLQGNSTSICQNAVWSSRPTCIELNCPSIPLVGHLIAVCHHDDKRVPCERDVVPGTRATLQCDNNYRMNSDGDNSSRIEITCSADGTWNTNPASYHCTLPECGIAPKTDDVTNFVNGTEIYVGNVPWPVIVYPERDRYSWCFGTLVKPDLVIAASCKRYFGNPYVRQDIEELRVVDTFDGLLLDDFRRSRSYHQERSVKNYRAYDHDIILFRLETPFVSKRSVSPLCMDWSLELDLPRAGELGMAFVFLSSGTSSGEWIGYKLSRFATLVIDNKECERLRNAAHERGSVTHNQFCIEVPYKGSWIGHYTNFAVRRNGTWYLVGVPNYFFCDGHNKRFHVLTKIGYHHMNRIKQFGKDV